MAAAGLWKARDCDGQGTATTRRSRYK